MCKTQKYSLDNKDPDLKTNQKWLSLYNDIEGLLYLNLTLSLFKVPESGQNLAKSIVNVHWTYFDPDNLQDGVPNQPFEVP